MSYSFSVRVAAAALASACVATKFDEVVAAQPIHEADRAQAEKAVAEILPLVGEPAEGQELSISVNGWIQKTGDTVTGVCVGVTASIVDIPDS